VPKGENLIGRRRKLHYAELHNLYCSPDIGVKSRITLGEVVKPPTGVQCCH
jgi:hypothetical protein